MDAPTRDRVLRLAGIELRGQPHPGQRYKHGWIPIAGMTGDALRIGGRMDLELGESLVGSDRVGGADKHSTVLLAATDGPRGRRLRVGVTLDEGKRSWTGRNLGGTVVLDEAGQARLRDGLAAMAERGAEAADRLKAIDRQLDDLADRRAEIERRQYVGMTKKQSRELAQLDKDIELEERFIREDEALIAAPPPDWDAGYIDYRKNGLRLQRQKLQELAARRAELVGDHPRQPLSAADAAKLAEIDRAVATLNADFEGNYLDRYLVEGSVDGEWGSISWNAQTDDTFDAPSYQLYGPDGIAEPVVLTAAKLEELIRLLGQEVAADPDARHRTLKLLGIEVRDDPTSEALRSAVDLFLEAEVRTRKWDPSPLVHPRDPGGEGGGQFVKNPVGAVAKILDRLKGWSGGEGSDDPFDGIEREPLRKTAVGQGLKIRRGADRNEIAEQLKNHVRDEMKRGRGEDVPSHRLTLSSPRYRDQDVGVYQEKSGKVSLYRESSSGQRGTRIVSADSLADLEQWGRDNDEPQVAKWAASERDGGKPAVKKAPRKAPAKKAAAPKSRSAAAAAAIDEELAAASLPAVFDRKMRASDLSPRDVLTNLASRLRDGESLDSVDAAIGRLATRFPSRPTMSGEMSGADRDREIAENGAIQALLGRISDRVDGLRATHKTPSAARNPRANGADLTDGDLSTMAKDAITGARDSDSMDPQLSAIAARQGFDGRPTVVSRREMDRLVAEGATPMYRGQTASETVDGESLTAAEVNEQLRTGPAFYGTGLAGPGYYLSTHEATVEDYSDGTPGSVVKAVLRPDVRRISMDEIEAQRLAYLATLPEDDWATESLLSTPAHFAAAKGYDVVDIPDPGGGEPWHVVLNRTALIVESGAAARSGPAKKATKAAPKPRRETAKQAAQRIAIADAIDAELAGPMPAFFDEKMRASNNSPRDMLTGLVGRLREGDPDSLQAVDFTIGSLSTRYLENSDVASLVGRIYERLEDIRSGRSSTPRTAPAKRVPATPAPAKAVPTPATGSRAAAAAPISLDADIVRPVGSSPPTMSERHAFDAYGNDGQAINARLRAGGRITAPIAQMDAAMSRSPLSEDVEVWRGVSSGADLGLDLSGDVTGAEFSDRSFTSTSVNRRTAEGFANLAGDGRPVILQVRVPRGTHAVADGDGGGILEAQGELLLERGLRFRVTADHGEVDGLRHLEVEVVPASTDPLSALRTMDTESARDALDLRKVPELKALLKAEGLPVSGTKRALVDRLVEHLGTAQRSVIAAEERDLDDESDDLGETDEPDTLSDEDNVARAEDHTEDDERTRSPAGEQRARTLALLGVTRAAGHDVTPGNDQLHHYWTRGEGLAKWIESDHQFYTLRDLLAEATDGKIPLETLSRWAASWVHEVTGNWPSSDAHRVAEGHQPRGHRIGPG